MVCLLRTLPVEALKSTTWKVDPSGRTNSWRVLRAWLIAIWRHFGPPPWRAAQNSSSRFIMLSISTVKVGLDLLPSERVQPTFGLKRDASERAASSTTRRYELAPL